VPTTVASGGSSTLTWSSTDATLCTASGGWSGALATSGSQSTGALTATTSYSLTCTSADGTRNVATVTVGVTQVPTVTLTASPTAVAGGGASTLTWSSTNATSCTASGNWSGTQPTSGTQSTGSLTMAGSYSLTCTGPGGTSNVATANVSVVAAPTVTLTANPISVASGGTSTLTWSSTNATSCTATGGWSGTKGPSGTLGTATLAATTSYSLTCSGIGGTSNVVTATVSVVPAPTVTLVANPTSVASGGVSTLSWSSSNATSCTATGGWSGTKATSGTQSTGAITMPSSYSLTCTGTGGTSVASTVLVNIIPTATLAAAPSVIASGGTSTLTWSSTNATSCTASGAGWSGSKATSGSQVTAALTATTSYSLSCSGAGGTSSLVTATVTISSGTVTVAPTIATLTVSQTQQFTATVPGGGAATWMVDGIAGGSAAVGIVTSAGLYTAGTAVGTHTVLATSVANSTQSGSAVVAVTDLAGVYTYHNDLARDGANMQEYALTTANVNTSSFGKLTSCSVDGAIYGQPLWVANLTVGGAKHNVVFVTTAHDSLYAFDADAVPCQQLWMVSLIDAAHGGLTGESTVPPNLFGANEGAIAPEVGVTSTPVIDPVSGLLYAVSLSINSAHTTYYHRLHAITLSTGTEATGSPVTIIGSYPTIAAPGTVSFDPSRHLQRAGLALVNGIVYVAFASQEDYGTWYGWVMSYQYSGTSLTQSAVLNVAPNASDKGGGIWMSGGAPAADSSNNLYLVTGNGGFDATSTTAPNNDYGDSLLKLTPSLTVSQYFTPTDQATDDSGDMDFGAGGAALLADLPAGSTFTHLLLCGGKDGTLYVLNRDAPGGYGDSNAVQSIAFGAQIFATGAFWNNKFYLGGLSAPLRAYQLTPSASPLFALSSSSSHSFVFPGSTPSVSAAATQNGIVWALDTSQFCIPGAPGCGPAVLYAYDATNLATALWNSSTVPADAAGFAVKFAVPTIANGKVYVGTRGNNTGVLGGTSVSGELDIYGLKP